jgi:hypothetical protein
VAVHFRGSDAISSLTIYGTIDRVTGDVEANKKRAKRAAATLI